MSEGEEYARLTNLLMLQVSHRAVSMINDSGVGDYPGLGLVQRLLERTIERELKKMAIVSSDSEVEA